jgi:hypothetical protein
MEQQEITEEVALHFRRFSAEKQDQIRALVNYATLMGLDGRDLVSIGNKLNRIAARRKIKYNQDITDDMLTHVELIGLDRKKPTLDHTRFVYVDAVGTQWHFDRLSYWSVTVTNMTTEVKKEFSHYDKYDLGRADRWTMRQVLMNLHDGIIQLNF